MGKQCRSQAVLESGSWGHSVLQTPALVLKANDQRLQCIIKVVQCMIKIIKHCKYNQNFVLWGLSTHISGLCTCIKLCTV